MRDEWEVTENNAQARIVFALKLVDRISKFATRRTLKITEFLECDRGIRAPENVTRLGVVSSGGRLIFRDVRKAALRDRASFR